MITATLEVEIYDNSEEKNCWVYSGRLEEDDGLVWCCVEWGGDPSGYRTMTDCLDHLKRLARRLRARLSITNRKEVGLPDVVPVAGVSGDATT